MSESGFKIDFSDFEDGFKKNNKNFTIKYADKAMFNAASILKLDADTIPPTTPKAQPGGELRSAIVFEHDGKINKRLVKIVWKMPYAGYQHRGERKDGTHKVVNYSEPKSGKEFVSKKMETRGKIYLEVIGGTYKKERS